MCGGVCLEDEGTCRQFYFQEQKKMGAGAGGDRWDVSPGALTGDRAQAGGQPNASNGVLDYLLEAVEDDAVRDTTTFILAGYKDEIEAPPPPLPPSPPCLTSMQALPVLRHCLLHTVLQRPTFSVPVPPPPFFNFADISLRRHCHFTDTSFYGHCHSQALHFTDSAGVGVSSSLPLR